MWRIVLLCFVLVCAAAHDHKNNRDHELGGHGHKGHNHGHNHEHHDHDIVDGRPVVRSPSGEFRGGYNVTRKGRHFETYRGIRYAEPPVGELRFQPPRPITHYPTPVDARSDGPACPLPAAPTYPVDEDCLTINVYTPLTTDRKKLLPVIFFIHPGGFYVMTGRSDLAGPHYLLDRDLVLVTINYRLGSLGFLSTGDAVAPGNNGFKDMVAALRWVNRNIRAFGGDPDNVTVAGCSAGSISAMLMMVSPMATGLFHRAISMSGSPVGKEPLPSEQRYLAVRQAELLNCPTHSSQAIVDCLKTKPWRDLGNSLNGFYEFGFDPVGIWTAVIEPDFGQERFLTSQPDEAIREKKLYAVPHLVSQTQDEFFWMAFTVTRNDTLREQMNSEWERVAPISFLLPRKNAEVPMRTLRRVYLKDRPLKNDETSEHDLGRLYVDSVEGLPVYRMAKLMTLHSPQPVYEYEWGYIGNHSHYEDPKTMKPQGAAHHDELIYLFTLPYRFPAIGLEGRDAVMVDRMTALWYNFARYGDPNPRGDTPELGELVWPKMTSDDMTYVRIDNDFSLRKDLFKDKVGVWDELYPMKY
uniref:Carboxylic ester hydrolase n=1 Tax=Pieris rapae TaxID=64459 RepID=A0A1U9X1V2_PIERA|nr:carboxylesterase [Pieris rapae]